MRAFLCAVVLVLAGALGFSQGAAPALSYVDGTVTIDGAAASVGDAVRYGAVVRTAAASSAEIEFNGRNAIRLSENTTLVFNPRNLQTGSELRQGGLAFVLKGLSTATAGPSFLVRTPSAVAGVRGTSFFMQVESPTSTYVCSCNGAVQVLDASGRVAKELAASHHKAVRISDTGSGPQTTDAPRLYHTDADLEKVAGDVGVTIDWNVIDR
ncbi:MAG TPA: FecR family protein [Spirochaetia bacterium]|nr:FecR family protein [Spirochaetia bacterium]